MTSKSEEPEDSPKIPGSDGNRRGFLSCMAWAGAGPGRTFNGGVPISRLFGAVSGSGRFSALFRSATAILG